MGRVRRVEVGGMVYHVLNRANFRSRLFKKAARWAIRVGRRGTAGARKRFLTPFPPPPHSSLPAGQKLNVASAWSGGDEYLCSDT